MEKLTAASDLRISGRRKRHCECDCFEHDARRCRIVISSTTVGTRKTDEEPEQDEKSLKRDDTADEKTRD
ncbi:unnamed protein product [Trichogramma brassicae]|uniref:Uncharacterized protein n=1 Tax=Trichogramma brassicae TaxID=86971 RepID=A0A6H5ICX5_9HYME|nr:unnamed protein product [Trichogramma brassicae]